MASIILNAISEHFRTTLSKFNQPHTITLHLEFLKPATAGVAFLEIKDTKVGGGTSTIHITLTQKGKEKVAGYATYSLCYFDAALS